VAALGDLATRTLAGGPHGVTQMHGQVRRAVLAGRDIALLPLYHPAAALHNARLLPALQADVQRLGELLGRTSVAAPTERREQPPPEPVATDEQQLGLF
jgi:uracil-DNA glycosylase family 4